MFQDCIFEILRQAHLRVRQLNITLLMLLPQDEVSRKGLNCGLKTNINATSNDLYRSGTVY